MTATKSQDHRLREITGRIFCKENNSRMLRQFYNKKKTISSCGSLFQTAVLWSNHIPFRNELAIVHSPRGNSYRDSSGINWKDACSIRDENRSAKILVGGMYGGLRSLISDLGWAVPLVVLVRSRHGRSWELKIAKFSYTNGARRFISRHPTRLRQDPPNQVGKTIELKSHAVSRSGRMIADR